MRRVKMARRLTLVYFLLFSIVLLSVHYAVFYATFEGVERSIAQQRIMALTDRAASLLTTETGDSLVLSEFISVYRDPALLPDGAAGVIQQLSPGYATEVHPHGQRDNEFFVLHTRLDLGGVSTPVWFVDYKEAYGLSREEVLWSQSLLLLLSLSVLVASLLVAQKIIGGLIRPFYKIASELSGRDSEDLSLLQHPDGTRTQESDALVGSINAYQVRLKALIERERIYNSYASHELRSPLTVIKGTVSLLKQSREPTFIDKQLERLSLAVNEMDEDITTLLDLTREPGTEPLCRYSPDEGQLAVIIASYDYLLVDKAVSWHLHLAKDTQLSIPHNRLKMLLGNLVKNAFSYTDTGQVDILVSSEEIKVVDSGVGLTDAPVKSQSHGLGLLIVRDICRKYGFELSLSDNDGSGCTAIIRLIP